MNKIKLIVIDPDNTLLCRDKTISAFTIDVFRRVRERGVLIAFATARDFRFITEHISPLFGIVPDIVIADNGALARYLCVIRHSATVPYRVSHEGHEKP